MGIGGSVFLVVFGAILVFAIKDGAKQDVEWIDLTAAGWIFMIAGVVGIAFSGWYSRNRRQANREAHESRQAARLARRDAIRKADAAANPVRQRQSDPMADERQAAD